MSPRLRRLGRSSMIWRYGKIGSPRFLPSRRQIRSAHFAADAAQERGRQQIAMAFAGHNLNFRVAVQLQRHAAAVALAPPNWLPWNYHAALLAAAPSAVNNGSPAAELPASVSWVAAKILWPCRKDALIRLPSQPASHESAAQMTSAEKCLHIVSSPA